MVLLPDFMSTPAPVSSNPVRVGVMASGSGSNFEAICQAIASGQLDIHIPVVIYNNPDAYVRERAKSWGIPAVLLDHRQYKGDRESFDRKIVETLQSFDVELVVMAGWMRRVTQVFLDGFPMRALNIHPSLLPSFPGLHAARQALDYGVKLAGCTVHWVTLEVDSGPIIAQAAVPVLDDDTEDTLQSRIHFEEHDIYPKAIAIAAQQIRQARAS
ncbi:MAG: phosphoribosylglycinamide formyltransferase [Cyanobacteria bacterium J06648_11]